MKFDVGDTVTVKGFGGKWEDRHFEVVDVKEYSSYPYIIQGDGETGHFSDRYLVLVKRNGDTVPKPAPALNPHLLIGQQVQANHPNAYRSGSWATIIEVIPYKPLGAPERMVYVVQFADGAKDLCPVYDESYDYEFRINWADPGWPATKNA